MSADTPAFVASYLRQLDDMIATAGMVIADGGAVDTFEKYRNLVGRRQGIIEARRVLLEHISPEMQKALK